MFKVEWLKDHRALERKAGDTFTMQDRTLFEAWRDDGLCREVGVHVTKQKKEDKRRKVTKPVLRSRVTK